MLRKMANDYPPFVLGRPRFDQVQYIWRLDKQSPSTVDSSCSCLLCKLSWIQYILGSVYN